MHRLTATVIIVIIFVAIVIVIMSSTGRDSQPSDALSGIPQEAISPTPPTASSPADLEASPSARYEKATIVTAKGTIVMELYPDVAPLTVSNFGNKAKAGFYNGLNFHRVEDWVVQGGDPLGNGTGGGNIKTELSDKPFLAGSLGVARGGDINISNDSQFFITKTDADWLNNQYTNFGIVTEGMDVVNKLVVGDTITSISVE